MSQLDIMSQTQRDQHPSAFQTLTIVAVVLTLLSLLWAAVDARLVDGTLVWMKPLKFSLSFVVLFATIALIETRLSAPVRSGWPMQVIAWVMAAAFVTEMAYMMYQGGRAEPSHFNMSTPFNAFMYVVVMATGAVALVVCIGAIGWIARRDAMANLGAGLREAIWLGCLLSLLLTLVVATYLSNMPGHHVGVHPDGGATLPLTGWSAVTGDLRVAHFLSLHAMQALPVLGVWLDRRHVSNPVRTIRIAALGYSILTFAVFGQAILGMPLIRLG